MYAKKDVSIERPRATAGKAATISASSRATNKQHFSVTKPFSLPQGDPTVAFNEKQTNCVLKIVADEAVRASHQAMEELISKTSQLRLHIPERQAIFTKRTKPSRTATFQTRPDSQCSSSSAASVEHLSDTSGRDVVRKQLVVLGTVTSD